MTPFDIESSKLNDRGLDPAIAQYSISGDTLMLTWMNVASIQETIEQDCVVY